MKSNHAYTRLSITSVVLLQQRRASTWMTRESLGENILTSQAGSQQVDRQPRTQSHFTDVD